jgi:hypothetical protein
VKKVYYIIYDMDEEHYRLCFRYDDEDIDKEVLVVDTKIGGIKNKETAVLVRDALNAFTPETPQT